MIVPARLLTESPGRLRQLLAHFASFELIFALFLHSNSYKIFIVDIVPLPVEETALLLAFSVLAGAWVLLRRGAPFSGLAAVAFGLLFFAWVALSWTWSPSRVLAWQEIVQLFTGGFWSLAGAALVIAAERERVIRFLAFTALIGISCTFGGWYYYLTYGNFLYVGIWHELGFAALYQQLAILAAMTGLVALSATTVIRTPSAGQAGALLAAVFAFSFLLVAGSRQSLLGALAGTILIVSLLPVHVGLGSLRVTAAHVLLLSILFLGATIVIYLVTAGVGLHTVGRLMSLFQNVSSEVYLRYDRPFYFSSALKLWYSSPLAGVGLMGFSPLIFGHEVAGTHPHDIILHILAETGLVGLTLFLLFLWMCYRRMTLARLRADRLALAVLATGMVPWAVALFSATIGTAWHLYAFLGLLTLPPPAVEAAPAAAPPRGPVARPPRVVH